MACNQSTTCAESPPPTSAFCATSRVARGFYLAVAAYVYICISTLQVHIPMGSVLGLLGISATTGLAAVAVDKQKMSTAQGQKDSLSAEKAALDTTTIELARTSPTQ